ncbi:MAG: 6-phosphofructokinase [Butyricicoccaceae bacterium]
MGHKAGWLTLHAGIASGADVIVIPEIPYSAKKIAQAIEKRAKDGKRFSIIAVAEGAVSRSEEGGHEQKGIQGGARGHADTRRCPTGSAAAELGRS